MTSIHSTIAIPAYAGNSTGAGTTDRLIRSALFFGVFLQVWLTASPFPDLSDPKLLEPVGDGNLTGQLLEIFVTASLVAFLYFHRLGVAFKALTPILIITLLWFACSTIFSLHPALAARRLILAALTIFKATTFLLLPVNRSHFVRLLAVGTVIILTLCYFGVIFLPERSIHQLTDVAEPDLQGNWRGFFTHKNGAGAGMVLLIFFGIYIIRSSAPILGTLIVTLASVFLKFTESKSPITLLPLVLVFSLILPRLRNPAAKIFAAICMPVIIGVMTVGSVEFDFVHRVVGQLLSDPSFTGRDVIWRFALDHVAERPIIGFGYQAFWGTSELLNNWTYLKSWGYRASDAHNGFLNIAVMTGVVGLVISMIWIFGQPLFDQMRAPSSKLDPALNTLFLQIWLFALYISGFESEVFSGGSIAWFMMVVSIIGFRFQTVAEYGEELG